MDRVFGHLSGKGEQVIHLATTVDGISASQRNSGEFFDKTSWRASCCFSGRLAWYANRSDGQRRRWLDTSRAERALGFRAKTPLVVGLERTVERYLAPGRTE